MGDAVVAVDREQIFRRIQDLLHHVGALLDL
jgi:hypothetical protein